MYLSFMVGRRVTPDPQQHQATINQQSCPLPVPLSIIYQVGSSHVYFISFGTETGDRSDLHQDGIPSVVGTEREWSISHHREYVFFLKRSWSQRRRGLTCKGFSCGRLSSLLLFFSVSRLKATWEALKDGRECSAYCTHNALAEVGQWFLARQ